MDELSLSFNSATDLGVEKIHRWLLEQDRLEVHDSFLCNWNLTLESHNEEHLLVANLDGEPVAYIWQDFGILEVRKRYRNKGIGKRLVEFAMNRAKEQDRCAIRIECQPTTSIPFWEKIGFDFYTDTKASFILQKDLPIPSEGEAVKVELAFYPESAKWDEKISPVKSFCIRGVRDKNNVVHLEKRLAAFYNRPQYGSGTVIKICIDEREIFFEKAKRPRAEALGLQYNSGAYCMEQVRA